MNAYAPIVLYVEDDPVTRHLVKRALMFGGFMVVEAENGDEAVAAVGRCSPDCVLVDLILPDEGGVEIARRLRAILVEEEREPPFLALSSSYAERKRAVASGVFAEVMTKPVTGAKLAEVIRGHIRRMPTDPAKKALARAAQFERFGTVLADMDEKIREIQAIVAELME